MRASFTALLSLLLSASLALAEAKQPEFPGALGDRIAPIVVPDPSGADHDITLPQAKDGRVAIYFWSVFCSNCKEAMPTIVSLANRYREKGLTVWAVNVDGDRFSNAVDAFLDEAKLPFPVVYDKLSGELLLAADPLSVTKTPTLILLDAERKVTLRQEVVIDAVAVEKLLQAN